MQRDVALKVLPGIDHVHSGAQADARIARFKRPKGYRFVEALPKNNYGKILKTELRDMLKTEEK